MSIVHRVEPDGVAIGTGHGVLTLDDARRSATALWADPSWPGRSALWDFRGARLEFSTSDVVEIARFVKENQRHEAPARMAFVTPSDSDFGMTRMFEAYRKDPRTALRVFREFDEALSWARSLSLDEVAAPS